MNSTELAKVKGIVVEVMQNRIKKLRAEKDRYKNQNFVTRSIQTEIHKMSNIQTEICVSIDDAFENEFQHNLKGEELDG